MVYKSVWLQHLSLSEEKQRNWNEGTEGRVFVSIKVHSLCWWENTTCDAMANVVKNHVRSLKNTHTISGALKTDSKEICPNLVHCAAADAIHILLRLRVRIGGSSESTIMEFLLTWWLLKRKNMLGPIVAWKWTQMHFKMSHQSLDDSAEKKCSTWGHISKANSTMTVFYLKQTFVKIKHIHYVNLTIYKTSWLTTVLF